MKNEDLKKQKSLGLMLMKKIKAKKEKKNNTDLGDFPNGPDFSW